MQKTFHIHANHRRCSQCVYNTVQKIKRVEDVKKKKEQRIHTHTHTHTHRGCVGTIMLMTQHWCFGFRSPQQQDMGNGWGLACRCWWCHCLQATQLQGWWRCYIVNLDSLGFGNSARLSWHGWKGFFWPFHCVSAARFGQQQQCPMSSMGIA